MELSEEVGVRSVCSLCLVSLDLLKASVGATPDSRPDSGAAHPMVLAVLMELVLCPLIGASELHVRSRTRCVRHGI